MKSLLNETMTKRISQIYTTTDYSLFKPINGNRNKNFLHINRLKKSMQEKYLFTVIIVNDKYEIIDGQHRFEVIKSLKLELNYIICYGYGLDEVHILNANAATWNADDYLTGYCNLGYEDYIIYKNFKEKYKLGHNETRYLLNNTATGPDKFTFYNGTFKVRSLKDAESIAQKLVLVEPFYPKWRRRTFLLAMLSLLKKHTFDFEEFMQKLKLQPTSMVDCTSVPNYISLIEDIYNFRRREKVNLRY